MNSQFPDKLPLFIAAVELTLGIHFLLFRRLSKEIQQKEDIIKH